MVKGIFERFGLSGNPFRDLASETIEFIDIFHVDQRVDKELKEILDEVSEKESKAFVAVVGGLGAGKTQRLMLVANIAEKKDYFCVFRTLTPEMKWTVQGIIETILDTAPLTRYEKYINAPKWFVELKKINKKILKGKGYDVVKTGKLIAEALNEKSPSFLLINDLQAMPFTDELKEFLETFYIIINNINPGVLIMVSSNKFYFDEVLKKYEALAQRMNKLFYIESLTKEQAEALVAKRLVSRRMTEDIGITYPFTKEAIWRMNEEVMGNPRQLLKFSDEVIEAASKKKLIEIDENFIIQYIKEVRGHQFLPPAPRNVEKELAMKGASMVGQQVATTQKGPMDIQNGITPQSSGIKPAMVLVEPMNKTSPSGSELLIINGRGHGIDKIERQQPSTAPPAPAPSTKIPDNKMTISELGSAIDDIIRSISSNEEEEKEMKTSNS